MDFNTKRIRLACYGANVTMAIVSNMSALLFLTFRNLYDISFTLMGTLVLINFTTQLLIDLAFSFFSHKFNMEKAVKIAPVLGVIGLVFYALSPFLFQDSVYLGLAVGTVIFSATCGLNEVLISPIIAALPSENPERDMSKTHSIYAWGVIFVVVFTTLFLLLFGQDKWFVLPLIFAVVPLFCAVMFFGTTLPKLGTPEKASGAIAMFKNKTVWLMVAAIFLGGACEIIMTQWCSGYLEQALNIPKVWGDIFGMATFALMLGLGRTLYAKRGKNLEKILFLSAIGATVCYLVCIFTPLAVLGLIACALTGLCVAMMWPGSLVVAAKRITTGGVFIYAIMAAGGDCGAAVAPQITGWLTDAVSASAWGASWAQNLGITVEQLAMKFGMSVGLIVSIIAIFVFLHIYRTSSKCAEVEMQNQ